MLELVPFEGLNGRSSGPKILVLIGGMKSMLKCQLANKALIDWQVVTVKKASVLLTSGPSVTSPLTSKLSVTRSRTNMHTKDWHTLSSVYTTFYPKYSCDFIRLMYARRNTLDNLVQLMYVCRNTVYPK